jgi:hypothetical protein
MKITGFQPLIVSPDADELISLFEDLGFVKRHEKSGINDQDITNISMKDANGNRVDVTKGSTLSRDLTAIRMNVDDFPEAFQILTKHGFKNAQGYKLTQTSSSTDTLMVSPSGFGIVLSQHFTEKL